MTDNSLFQEVQEDLERQKIEALWKKYGFAIIIAAVGIVMATGSYTAYRSWQSNKNQQLTEGLLAAFKPLSEAEKKPEVALDMLGKYVAEHGGSSQAGLALLRAGVLAVEKNDKVKALAFFDQVAADGAVDPAFRQLGDLYAVLAQLDDGDVATLSKRLEPLTEAKAPWRYSALEYQAYLALRGNDQAKAKQIFTDLSQDARAPQGISARATDILRSLNGG